MTSYQIISLWPNHPGFKVGDILTIYPSGNEDDKKYLEGEVKEINLSKTYQAKVGFSDGTVVYYPAELIRKGEGYYLKIKL